MQAQGTENRPCYCWCRAGMGESSGQGLLWVSQHCRLGAEGLFWPSSIPSFASPPKTHGWNWSWPGVPRIAQQGLQEELGFHWPQSWQQSSGGARDWGFPRPPVSQAPTTGITQQGPEGSAGFSGDTGERQRTLESSLCTESGIAAS